MGGKAFLQVLPDAVFPRILPESYQLLKDRITSQLKSLYTLVETPSEAPEKLDHGDLDFVVFSPLREVTHEHVKQAIGASCILPMDGNRTSNYAIPGEKDSEFYQVDVHVCQDEDELERIVFFHSYGDLGMIMGILARAHGLAIGTKGLKIVSPQADISHPPSFHLSSSFPQILPFFTLSFEAWKKGFSTRDDVFAWVSTSRFFDPRRLSDTHKRQNERKHRAMYQSFLEYAQSRITLGLFDVKKTSLSSEAVIEEAKVYFGKKEEYDAIVYTNVKRSILKSKFTGTLVMDWTGLYGFPVRRVMDGVRATLSDDEICEMETDELKAITIQVQTNLGLRAHPGTTQEQ